MSRIQIKILFLNARFEYSNGELINLNVLDGDFVKLSRNDIEVNHLNP